MSEILNQQEEATDALIRMRKSLNQTMREELARHVDPGLLFQSGYADGAYVISRKINPNDIDGSHNITRFQKTPIQVQLVNELKAKKVETCVKGAGDKTIPEFIELLHLLGLLDFKDFEFKKESGEKINDFTVHYTLKNSYHVERYHNTRFRIVGCREIFIEKSDGVKRGKSHQYSVLHGQDPDNHSYFFRVYNRNDKKTAEEEEEEDSVCMVREGIVLFNHSNRLEISSIPRWGISKPIQCNLNEKDDEYRIISETTQYKSEHYDPTLYFLRSVFPASRHIKSTSRQDAFPNEEDVVAMTAHKRACAWQIARLHWVYEGLCSVIASMAVISDAGPGDGGAIKSSSHGDDDGEAEPIKRKVTRKSRPRTGGGGETRGGEEEEEEEEEDDDDYDRVSVGSDVTVNSSLDPGQSVSGSSPNTSLLSPNTVIPAGGCYKSIVEYLLENGSSKQINSWEKCRYLIHNCIISGIDLSGISDKKDLVKKPNVRLGSLNHDDMLKKIAMMAKLATEVFIKKNTAFGSVEQSKLGLLNLNSPYNNEIGKCGNDLEMFGYRLAQWLLTNVEQRTIVIAKKDQGTDQAEWLRVRLMDVNCQLYTIGHRSVYTTDVLMGMMRKFWIAPWKVIYGTDEGNWPTWLRTYSVKKFFSNAPRSDLSPINDKLVSVALDITHKIRLTFHAFKHKIESANPVAVNKKLLEAIAQMNHDAGISRKKKKKSSIIIMQRGRKYKFGRTTTTTPKALKPITGKRKQIMLKSGSTEEIPVTIPGQFLWDKPGSTVYSWQNPK